jgi:hypothetical protein
MIISRMLVIVLLVFLSSLAALGQQVSCSCDSAPGRTCHGVVKCPDGCTSLCGPGDACYLSCRSNTVEPRITTKFVKQTGQEIAGQLSSQTHQRIEFIPDRRNQTALYDLELNNDDLFNALKYLYKRGKVRFNGLDFLELQKLRKQLKDGKKISVKFVGIPAKDAVSRLAFVSGKRLRIQQGDPEQNISVMMQDATLNQIIARISETGHLTIRK